MRNLKRALCLALASVMVLGMTVIGASAATASDFTDYDTVEEKEALDVMAAINVIEGTDSGAFDPDGHFTREQAAKILSVMLLGASNADKLNNNAQIFKDVAAGRWSAGYIAYCSNVGIIAGDGQGNFNPEGELDSVSFGKMLLVALGYDPAKEGYINNPGWQQSISGDMIAAGIDVKDVKFDDVLTREQATVMAFKAIQTPLVEYANYLDPSKATYVTTTLAEEQTISSRVLSNTAGDTEAGTFTIEFAEKYQQDLMRSPDPTEEFRRPAHKWTVGSTNIGRYTDTPDKVYTTEVTTGQIYSDLGLSDKTNVIGGLDTDEAIEGNVSSYYIDGRPTYLVNENAPANSPTWKSFDPEDSYGVNNANYSTFALENKGAITLGGNGTLTEVYYYPVSYSIGGGKESAKATIVSVNTYVGDVTSKVGETDKHVAYITVTPRYDDTLTTNGTYRNPELDPRPRDPVLEKNFYINTYDTEDFALEDLVLFNYSLRRDNTDAKDCGIQSVKVADVVTGELTAYTENERAAVDSESYSYSTKVAKEAKAVDLNYDVNAVLDDYGYVIDIDPVGQNTGYAVILKTAFKNADDLGSGDWNDTDAAQLLLTNGTVVDKALVKAFIAPNDSTEYNEGDIVYYTVDNRGRYSLSLVANINGAGNITDSINHEFLPNTPGTKAYDFVIENGKDKIQLWLNQENSIMVNGSTIFLVKDLDGNNDPVYNAYYGIKNVPDIDTRDEDEYKDVTVILDENNFAVVVYIDASGEDTIINTSDEDYVYVLYDPKVEMKHDTERGDYFRYDAIVNGELTTIDVNERTYRAMDPDYIDKDQRERVKQADLEDLSPESTLFTNVQVDDYDIYSLEEPHAKDVGIIPVANDALSIGVDGDSYVTAESCEIFYIGEKNAVSEITAPTVTEDLQIKVSHFEDTIGNLVCVVIDEYPKVF